MSFAKELAKIVAIGSIPVAIFMGIWVLATEIPATRRELVAAVHQEGDRTRDLVVKLYGDTLTKVDDHADHLQNDSKKLADKIEIDTFMILKDMTVRLDRRLGETQSVISDRLGETTRSVDAVLQPAGKILEKVDRDLLPALTDCENNPSCFENRWRGLSYDAEQTMRSVQSMAKTFEKAVPPILENVEKNTEHSAGTLEQVRGITTDLHKVTTEFTKPQPLYKKILGMLLLPARIAGALL